MRARIAQYMNEIVSLTIMALMCIALIGGQADAYQQDGVARAPENPTLDGGDAAATGLSFEDGWLVVDKPNLKVDIALRVRHTGE